MLAVSLREVLSDPVWASVGVVVAILIAVVIHRKQHSARKKSLAQEITERSLVSVGAEAQDRVTIIYESRPVERVHLVEVRLLNDGKAPIIADDFEGPLTISLGEGAEVMTLESPVSDPSALDPAVSIDGSCLRLEPLLLNPGDSLLLKALVGGFQGPVQVEARIAGVPRLTDIRRPPNRRPLFFVALSAIVVVVATNFASGLEHARRLSESETETAVRHYVESVESDRRWEGEGPAQVHEAGKKLLIAEWQALSPYRVHEHQGEGQHLDDLGDLYDDTELFAERPVVLRAFVNLAYSSPIEGNPDLVRQELHLGVRDEHADATCDITRPKGDRFGEGDYLEVRGVALASGRFNGDPDTYLACASAGRKRP